MKKRIWGIVVGIMVLALGMFVVGVLKRKPIKEDSEGETYLEQVEADKEKVKTEGSVFPKGSHQIYNGFGFTVTYFHVYDTYEEFVESEHYNSDYVETDPKIGRAHV